MARAISSHTERGNPYPQGHRCGLCGPQKPGMGRCLRMQNHCHAFDSRCNFLKRLQPFAPDIGFEIGESGDVASWMREAFHKPSADRVRDLQKQNRLTMSCISDRLSRGIGHRKDEIRPRRDCLFRVDIHALDVTIRENVVDLDIASYGPSGPL